jgi:glutathione S-transferase
MVKIYGVMRSRATRNHWLAGDMGFPVEMVPVIQHYRLPDPEAPGAMLNTRSPEFLALSPQGAIPVMDDEGFVLAESLAINLYLAKKHGGPLAPADAQEEAEMVQWSLYGAASIEGAALPILYAYAQGRAGTPEGKAEIEAACVALRRPFAVLDAHLAKAGHLVGGRFTVADVGMAECVRFAQSHAPLMGEFPALNTWLLACQARPAFKTMFEKRLTEPA